MQFPRNAAPLLVLSAQQARGQGSKFVILDLKKLGALGEFGSGVFQLYIAFG